MLQFFRSFFFTALKRIFLSFFCRLFHRPITFNKVFFVRCFHGKNGSRFQFINIFINRIRCRNITMDKINGQCSLINFIAKSIQRSNTPYVGRKSKISIYPAIVKRFFTNPVTKQIKLLFLSVIQSNGKHPFAEADSFFYTIILKKFQ